jgi:hypothetical protein
MLEIFGGPDRDRTDDLFHAMEARSQLRHRPTCCFLLPILPGTQLSYCLCSDQIRQTRHSSGSPAISISKQNLSYPGTLQGESGV